MGNSKKRSRAQKAPKLRSLPEQSLGFLEALAVHQQIAPPTANLFNVDAACDLDYVPLRAREMPIRAALSNSFGFGGTNGTLIFARI